MNQSQQMPGQVPQQMAPPQQQPQMKQNAGMIGIGSGCIGTKQEENFRQPMNPDLVARC